VTVSLATFRVWILNMSACLNEHLLLLQPERPVVKATRAGQVKSVGLAKDSEPNELHEAVAMLLESSDFHEVYIQLRRSGPMIAEMFRRVQPSSDSRSGGLDLLKNAAYQLDGDTGESVVRRAIADIQVSTKLRQRHGLSGALTPVLERDTFLLLCCIAQAGRSPASLFMLQNIWGLVSAYAERILDETCQFAAGKGLKISIAPEDVCDAWDQPCQSLFEYFADRQPNVLRTWLQDESLTGGLRALAADAVSRVEDPALARELLLPLIETAPLVVREAAIYGLAPHLDDTTKEGLKRLAAESGTHIIVRDAVEGLLDVA
jgi:hypothetical protein